MSGAVVVVVVATLFLAMGGYGLAAPAALIRPFGITLPGPEARAEVRAVYGGFGVAVGLMLIVAAMYGGGVRTGAVIAVAAALLGMAGGRVISRLLEPPGAFYPTWFYFWVEVIGASLLLLAA